MKKVETLAAGEDGGGTLVDLGGEMKMTWQVIES